MTVGLLENKKSDVLKRVESERKNSINLQRFADKPIIKECIDKTNDWLYRWDEPTFDTDEIINRFFRSVKRLKEVDRKNKTWMFGEAKYDGKSPFTPLDIIHGRIKAYEKMGIKGGEIDFFDSIPDNPIAIAKNTKYLYLGYKSSGKWNINKGVRVISLENDLAKDNFLFKGGVLPLDLNIENSRSLKHNMNHYNVDKKSLENMFVSKSTLSDKELTYVSKLLGNHQFYGDVVELSGFFSEDILKGENENNCANHDASLAQSLYCLFHYFFQDKNTQLVVQTVHPRHNRAYTGPLGLPYLPLLGTPKESFYDYKEREATTMCITRQVLDEIYPIIMDEPIIQDYISDSVFL
jgi:hypothetical protein